MLLLLEATIVCSCLLEGHLCVHFSLGCGDRSIRRPGGARTLSLSRSNLQRPAPGSVGRVS
jgi:hypothetical protein